MAHLYLSIRLLLQHTRSNHENTKFLLLRGPRESQGRRDRKPANFIKDQAVLQDGGGIGASGLSPAETHELSYYTG